MDSNNNIITVDSNQSNTSTLDNEDKHVSCRFDPDLSHKMKEYEADFSPCFSQVSLDFKDPIMLAELNIEEDEKNSKLNTYSNETIVVQCEKLLKHENIPKIHGKIYGDQVKDEHYLLSALENTPVIDPCDCSTNDASSDIGMETTACTSHNMSPANDPLIVSVAESTSTINSYKNSYLGWDSHIGFLFFGVLVQTISQLILISILMVSKVYVLAIITTVLSTPLSIMGFFSYKYRSIQFLSLYGFLIVLWQTWATLHITLMLHPIGFSKHIPHFLTAGMLALDSRLLILSAVAYASHFLSSMIAVGVMISWIFFSSKKSWTPGKKPSNIESVESLPISIEKKLHKNPKVKSHSWGTRLRSFSILQKNRPRNQRVSTASDFFHTANSGFSSLAPSRVMSWRNSLPSVGVCFGPSFGTPFSTDMKESNDEPKTLISPRTSLINDNPEPPMNVNLGNFKLAHQRSFSFTRGKLSSGSISSAKRRHSLFSPPPHTIDITILGSSKP